MIQYPDYKNGLVNLASSILKEFDIQPGHSTLPFLDRILTSQEYQNVVVMLFDGLGVKALQDHLPADALLRQQLLQPISSVFPPTTTAATTSLQTAQTPAEHGWLGWDLFFPEIRQIVVPFRNTIKDTNQPGASFRIADKYLPLPFIVDRIETARQAHAYTVSPFAQKPVRTLDGILDNVVNLTQTPGRKFIYAYWPEPDGTMHAEGSDSVYVKEIILDLNQRVEALSRKLRDTLLIVTADHGHGNISNLVLEDYPALFTMLARSTSIEPRAVSFHLKPEFVESFPSLFNQFFGEDFLLFTHQEVIEKKLFGDGPLNPHVDASLGDYLAAAISDKALVYSHQSNQFKSHHAGLTDYEMQVPLIAIDCK